uniref:Uncharacterized protein n=1 Tax=Anguilla anguilla TaxID=7936 RepID=A0A0E9TRG8_ANGAN
MKAIRRPSKGERFRRARL